MFMASVGHECSDAPLRNAVWPPATYEDLALYATANQGHTFFLGNSCQCGYQGQIAIKKAAINSVSRKKSRLFYTLSQPKMNNLHIVNQIPFYIDYSYCMQSRRWVRAQGVTANIELTVSSREGSGFCMTVCQQCYDEDWSPYNFVSRLYNCLSSVSSVAKVFCVLDVV